MPRVKRGTKRRQRRNKLLVEAKGYRGARSRQYTTARNAVFHARRYAYRDRRRRKRDFRRLWIVRINAAVRQYGMSYSRFIHGMNLAGVEIDRKNLADLALAEPSAFRELIEVARQQLPA